VTETSKKVSRRTFIAGTVGGLAVGALAGYAGGGLLARQTETSNEGVVRKIFEGSTDVQYTDDFAYLAMGIGTLDKEAMDKLYGTLFETFPDVSFWINRMISQGNTVVVEYTLSATHNKDWAGIPATGKKFEYIGVEIYDFEAGKVKLLKSFGPLMMMATLRSLSGTSA